MRGACDSGNVKACSYVGMLLEPRDGLVARDVSTAARYFGRACDGSIGHSCWRLAGLHLFGDGVPADHARAADLYRRAIRYGGLSESQQNIARAAIASFEVYGKIGSQPAGR
jgi:TPR repeat protein